MTDHQRAPGVDENFTAEVRTPPPQSHKQVTVAYAYCCSGSVKYCDCVNKNHGTALMGANEAGDDYPIASPSPQPKTD